MFGSFYAQLEHGERFESLRPFDEVNEVVEGNSARHLSTLISG